MPQLAVAVVGAWAGSAALGATAFTLGGVAVSGAAVGWTAGSIIGGYLFGPNPQNGPRIRDGKYQTQVYGESIPISYGTMRHAAHVLWWSGLRETKHTSGHGGFFGSLFTGGKVSTYTYACSLLLSVCESTPENPVGAVLRIWGNGRLIWQADGTADGKADTALIQPGNVRIYLGGEDQEPDPLYEADVGAENAPAYRGQCTVMLEGLQLEFAGNRPPSIEVEVAQVSEAEVSCPLAPLNATAVQRPGLFIGTDGPWGQLSSGNAFDAETKTLYVVTQGDGADAAKKVERYDCSGSVPSFLGFIYLPGWDFTSILARGLGWDPVNNVLRVAGGWNGPPLGLDTTIPIEYQVRDGVPVGSFKKFKNTIKNSGTNTNGAYKSGLYAIYAGNSGEAGWWSHGTSILSVTLGVLRNDIWYGVLYDDGRRYIRTAEVTYVPPDDGVIGDINIAWRWDIWEGYVDASASQTTITGSDASDTERYTGVVYAPSRKKVYICTRSDGIAVIDVSEETGDPTTLSRDLTPYPGDMTVMSGYAFFVWNNAADALIVGDVNAGGTRVRLIDPDTMEVLIECSFDNLERISGPKDIGDGRFACILGTDKVAIVSVPGGGSVTGEPVTLQFIVEDLCRRAGLPAENLDASAGTDLVQGYKIATPSTPRAAIEALRSGYFFDMQESGDKLVLKKRGGAAVATIDVGELGARVFAVTADDVPPPYECEHVDEGEAPRVLELVYIDATADYDPGLQRAFRSTGSSRAPLRIEVPVVFAGGATEAARAAWTNLLVAHAAKNKVRLALTHAREALDGADPIMVPFADGTLRRVYIERLTRARPLLEIEGTLEDVDVYSQTMSGVEREGGGTQTPLEPAAQTLLALMDLPPLRDIDDVLLVYVAMGPDVRGRAWPGASLYKSVDGGGSYVDVLDVTTPATIGTTSNALGDWQWNTWDDRNTLDVTLASGTFSSATSVGVLAGINAIAVQSGSDWEVVQFRDATLVATNTWRLSNLLRGRRGTERATGGHAAGDLVVLLVDGSVQALGYEIAEVGLDREWKAPTGGQAIADADARTVALAANSLRPLAPVHIAGERAGDDLTIEWTPRVRVGGGWDGSRIIALDEPVEAYEVDVLDGGTVLRTLSASTPTVAYTGAQQTTDFGAPQPQVEVRVYQISSRVGRGHAGAATV